MHLSLPLPLTCHTTHRFNIKFVDFGVEVNEASYCDVLLSQQFILAVHQVIRISSRLAGCCY